MDENLREAVCSALGASSLRDAEVIQSLWSGYGEIARYTVVDGSVPFVVVKLVQLPKHANHPRGWNTNISHERKVRSYEVEKEWYQRFSARCSARVPECYIATKRGGDVQLALEDLDASGFEQRLTDANFENMELCLAWLAEFHACFMDAKPAGLWEKGTYWNLDTRPDELAALTDLPLKAAARKIDDRLEGARYKTLVHGDAKLANFCFSSSLNKVAAVDFQYVGGGCGMKDAAYFIGSCLRDTDCEKFEGPLLDSYFRFLKASLEAHRWSGDAAELVQEWRALYPVAWADFHRFIKGWSPGHWKVHSYSERIARGVISEL